jgi:hypothetical protein
LGKTGWGEIFLHVISLQTTAFHDKERKQYLLDQYLSNKATEEEKEAFLNWHEQTPAQGHERSKPFNSNKNYGVLLNRRSRTSRDFK